MERVFNKEKRNIKNNPRVEKTNGKTIKNDNRQVKGTDIILNRGAIDIPMLIITLLLLCYGCIMVFSASYAFSYESRGDSYYYIKRELIFAVIGLVCMIGAIFLASDKFMQRISLIFYGVAIFLLLIVPFIGIGKGVARRWINLGLFTVQPSEIAKVALVFALATYFTRYQSIIATAIDRPSKLRYGMIFPFIYVVITCGLIVVEKHISGTLITFLIGMLVIFAAGADLKIFTGIGAIGLVIVSIVVAFSSYGKTRIDAWLHPENYRLEEAYQTIQGINAIGSGGVFGVGLGNSVQKQLYVSQPMNDFIFSIICEELGLVGAVALIVLFGLLIWRGITISQNAPNTFTSIVALGLTIHLGLEAILNMMVVTGLAPNTGISLPFISYGGTALIINLTEIGIILSISRYKYQRKDVVEKI